MTIRLLAAVLVIALTPMVSGACNSDSDPAEEATAKPVPNQFRSLDPKPCSDATVAEWPHGGGYDVWRVGVSCEEAGMLVPRLGSVLGRNESLGVQDRGNGWTCWGELLKREAAIQLVCWNEDQVLSYKVA